MTDNPYTQTIQKLLDEGYLIVVAHTTNKKQYEPGKVTGYGIFCRYEQGIIVKNIVNKEIRKVPKWMRKLFKIKTI